MRARITIVLLAGWQILLATSDARAQDAADRAAAEALFKEGITLFDQKRFPEACPKFEESLKLIDGLGTRGKLAECYEKADRIASAWAMYREVAHLAEKRGERRRQRAAESRAARLEAELAYLTVTMAAPPAEVKLVLNGREIGASGFGTPIPVDSGAQQVAVTAPGHREWSSAVEVGHKGKVTIDVPALEPLPAEPPPVVQPPQAPIPASHIAPTPLRRSRPAWRLPTTIGLIAGGAVGIGAGLVFGALAKSKWDQAFDDGHCTSDNVCTDRGIDLTDQARSRASTATILTVSGLVLAGAGVAVWLWPLPETDAVAVAPAVSSGRVDLAITGRF